MSNLYRPGRNFWQPARGSQRPLWPFTINRDSLQAEGLIVWWPFEPGGGNILLDLSDNRNNGTLTMDPNTDWVGNEFLGGHALDFDGIDDIVNAGSDSTIDNIFAGGGGTCTAWIKPRTIGETFGRIVDKASSELQADGWTLLIQSANPLLSFGRGFTTNVGNWDTPDDSITLNAWHHVAVTYDEASDTNDPVIYIDGESQSISETAVPSGSAQSDAAEDLTIGNFSTTTRTFDGLIDDIRLYDRILTSTEIRHIYNPRTRWDLVYPLRQRIYFDMGEIITRNYLAIPRRSILINSHRV